MKRLLWTLCLLAPLAMAAQESETLDTILYVKGRKVVVNEKGENVKIKMYERISTGDTIENDPVFEGVYKNGRSIERRFAISIPFVSKKKNHLHFSPHYSGINIGYNSFGSSDGGVDLSLSKSWEIGISLISTGFSLTQDGCWGLATGVGWGYVSFRLNGDRTFQEVNGNTVVVYPQAVPEYSKGRLRYNYFRVPLLLEYRSHFAHYKPFISGGLEAEIRYRIQSRAQRVESGNSKRLGSDMNVNPIGINLMAQAGLDDVGFYVRYSLNPLFKSDRGPGMHPLTLGVCWWW